MFFKRRSRASSYIEPTSPSHSRSQTHSFEQAFDRFDGQSSQHNAHSADNSRAVLSDDPEQDMYSRPHHPQEVGYGSPRMMNGALPMNTNSRVSSNHSQMPPPPPAKHEPTPDLLQHAFNQALVPYTDKIADLEAQLADMQAWVEQLEMQRQDFFEWVDKRGLRPDVPPSIAKAMDNPTSTPSPSAALSLSSQLDRKITIVNFDLHRLQDDLNAPLPTAHFGAAMLKFLPDIARLSALPTGPRLAFDLILKLGGNLNSHGGVEGLDTADSEDLAARNAFYARLDAAMVEVVRGRFDEAEDWPVAREIRRIQKTAEYLRAYGVEPYFPRTLDLMRAEEPYVASNASSAAAVAAAGAGAGAPQQQQSQQQQQQQQQMQTHPQGTPPRYQ